MARKKALILGQAGSWAWWDAETGECKASINYRVGGKGWAKAVTLAYTVTVRGRSPEDLCYSVPVAWSACHFGGARPWFRCPGCHRRVALLYADRLFLCRHCLGLTYASRQEDRASRLLRKAQKIRKRLGGSVSLDEPFPDKPKGMHWRTYWRLWEEAIKAQADSWEAFASHYRLEAE